ncbi:MAG: hypothetical protein M3298_04315 [Thermoproteota archaeon]|nr:hypothetical protein [Thermoproteota archaeon]MDQ3807373.1 hypothetical protein [Thermoproteota archaeon]MDQ3883235.1 hypothetical protein [Thermoproteota archaeon]MDQ5841948.1 hypothetical protein [Thermoproteota archaeon]
MKIDYELLNSLCEEILAKHSSIRWTGIVNRNGVILAQTARKGAKLLLSEEESEEYAATAIARQKTRGKFAPKIGKMVYSFGRYELLQRATIPIDENYYLLVSLEVEEKNFDSIIMDKILPVIIKSRSRFATTYE